MADAQFAVGTLIGVSKDRAALFVCALGGFLGLLPGRESNENVEECRELSPRKPSRYQNVLLFLPPNWAEAYLSREMERGSRGGRHFV